MTQITEGQSLYTHKKSNVAKTWFLLTILFGVILGFGFFLSVYFDSFVVMAIAAGVSIFGSVTSYWFADDMVLKMSGVEIIDRAGNKELYDIVDNLAIAGGMPTPKIGIMRDGALNAFATGRTPEKGVVVFTEGLLQTLTTEELRGVAAHEISHIANRDTLIGTIAVVLASIVAMSVRMMHFGGARQNDSRRGGIVMIIGLALMILAPLVSSLLRMAISRKREFLADTSGAMLSGNPEGLASALEKIGGSPQSLDHAHESTAHLFISNPFGNGMQKLSRLFATHPPIEERVARLRGADKYGEI